ncbi:hypothetical protein AK830_g5759 [Neonectria ditissima]|uniref:Uncharacterized protein n=1 Tax=Neonectria ditissima TaxID=78410 RepID=A0A0P7BL14_9HYPO|nr:hypothetical protein AK830_g5759 [Neonectria ditissima]
MSHKGSSKGSSKKHGGHSKASSNEGQVKVSFVFMVNELRYDGPETDCYHNLIPPTAPAKYTDEIASKVMRYHDGVVSDASEFFWTRDTTSFPAVGCLWGTDGATGESFALDKYKSCAVFACNPHLPIMVTAHDPLAEGTRSCWQLLQLFHPRDELSGITQVATEDSRMPAGGGLVRYAAGSKPTWIPSLLPETYKTPWANAPNSRGLGGELAVILGLMALSAGHDSTNSNNNTNHVFLGYGRGPGRWHRKKWTCEEEPKGCEQQFNLASRKPECIFKR